MFLFTNVKINKNWNVWRVKNITLFIRWKSKQYYNIVTLLLSQFVGPYFVCLKKRWGINRGVFFINLSLYIFLIYWSLNIYYTIQLINPKINSENKFYFIQELNVTIYLHHFYNLHLLLFIFGFSDAIRLSRKKATHVSSKKFIV